MNLTTLFFLFQKHSLPQLEIIILNSTLPLLESSTLTQRETRTVVVIMPQKLQDLPDHLRRWYATPAQGLPAEDNKCFTCWREYDTVEEELDPNEQPCEALRMQPCNHLIGSCCLLQLLKRGMLNCPHCNTEIATSTTVPFWIVWLLKHDRHAISPAVWLDYARAVLDDNPPDRHLKHFDHLNNRLFAGTLGLYDGLWLWLHYMVYPVVETVLAMMCFSIANVISYLIV